jgi:hypothetical protein
MHRQTILVERIWLMSGGEVTVLLLGILGGALLSRIIWRAFRLRLREAGSVPTEKQVDILLVLLIIAAFAMGVFLTYALVHAF